MVRHAHGWDITKRIDSKRRICMRQFSGSKVDCMEDYMKLCIRDKGRPLPMS